MKHSEIKHVLESRFEKINEFLGKITKNFNDEDIHDLRVQVKKLRAFVRLAATGLPGPPELKIPYHLKAISQDAGNIRNLQLQQHRIIEFLNEGAINQPHQYLGILLDHQKVWKQKIIEVYNQKALESEEEMIIRTLRFRLSETTIKKYIQNKVDELKNLLAVREYSDDELHQVRKILKDVLYTLPYTGHYFFSFFEGGLQTKEEIESQTEILGEFQDACIALQLAEPVYTNEINDQEEKKLLQTIIEEWKHKKSQLTAAIFESLAQIHPAISF